MLGLPRYLQDKVGGDGVAHSEIDLEGCGGKTALLRLDLVGPARQQVEPVKPFPVCGGGAMHCRFHVGGGNDRVRHHRSRRISDDSLQVGGYYLGLRRPHHAYYGE